MPHRFEATGDFLKRLEGPQRKELVPPDKVIADLKLSKTDVLADLGAGTGYLALPASERVSDVVALDVEPKMLEVLSGRIRERRRDNIRLVRGDISRLPLADGSVDRVLAAFVYHEIEDRPGFVREISRVLRPGGRLDIVDFQKRPLPIGPPVSEKKTPEQVARVVSRMLAPSSTIERPAYYQLAFMKPLGTEPVKRTGRPRRRAR